MHRHQNPSLPKMAHRGVGERGCEDAGSHQDMLRQGTPRERDSGKNICNPTALNPWHKNLIPVKGWKGEETDKLPNKKKLRYQLSIRALLGRGRTPLAPEK